MRIYSALGLVGLMMIAPGWGHAAPGALPTGITTRSTEAGLALADGQGRLLYRLDLDRYRARRKDAAHLVDARCAGVCDKLWLAVPAPRDFHPGDDWGVVQRAGGPPQITFKGDPLYAFVGKSLDEAAALNVAPPYFSSYSAPPVELRQGVPTVTLYWHQALYQPPAPKIMAPGGVNASWFKASYVFADPGGRKLYAPRRGRECTLACGDLEPLPAPLAALAVGDWRPVEGGDGQRVWSFKGRTVYRAQGPAEPDADWQILEVR
jgi:predicted lipoprotein with Yx(FWY)xxD motif